MGISKRTHIKSEQRLKRKKRRAKLIKAGQNPDEVFNSGIYISKNGK